jgi:glutathione peroxidase
MSEFYELKAKGVVGNNVKMDEYKGKVILVVNTASECGFTPQFKGLEELYQKYSSEGLVILGFPCNQFGKQEPLNGQKLLSWCELNYGISFPMFAKIEVNGDNTHPIFKYLKENLTGLLGSRIKWNFTKFLINKEGQPIERFAPKDKPQNIEAAIVKLLKP